MFGEVVSAISNHGDNRKPLSVRFGGDKHDQRLAALRTLRYESRGDSAGCWGDINLSGGLRIISCLHGTHFRITGVGGLLRSAVQEVTVL